MTIFSLSLRFASFPLARSRAQGQFTEEQILDNNENSPMFEEFLQLLGDKVRLRGFDKYKGGLGERMLNYDARN